MKTTLSFTCLFFLSYLFALPDIRNHSSPPNRFIAAGTTFSHPSDRKLPDPSVPSPQTNMANAPPDCNGTLTVELDYSAGDCLACTCSGSCNNCKFVHMSARVMVNDVSIQPGDCGWSFQWTSDAQWCSIANSTTLNPTLQFRMCDLQQTGNIASTNVNFILLKPSAAPIFTSMAVTFPVCPPPPPVCNHTPPVYLPFPKCTDEEDGGDLPTSCPQGVICPDDIGNPPPTTIDIGCDSGNDIASYLARQVEAKHLWWLLDQDNLSGPPGANFDLCAFCEHLKLLVSLKATMITYTSQYDGHQVSFFDNNNTGSFIDKLGSMVASINYAFDCAGLKRPVIQGGIWETMASSVCRVPISSCVINHFYDEIIAAGPNAIARYLSQSPVYFNYEYICRDDEMDPTCPGDCDLQANPYPPSCHTCHPDFAKLETRMWFYHMGMLLIDAGFTSILIGNGDYMGANENGTDAANFYQTSIVNDLRAYAASLPQPTDLIIKLESGDEYLYANDNGNFPSTELLGDYNALNLRPREIFLKNGTPVNAGALNDQNTTWPGCQGSDGDYDPLELFGPACNGMPYLAFFDICHSGGFHSPNLIFDGTSPSGCPTENLPRIFTWDSGPHCYTNYDGPPSPPGQYYKLRDNNTSDNQPCDLNHLQNCVNSWDPSYYSVWGWDDLTWWSVGFKPVTQGAIPDPSTGIVAIDLNAPDNDACRLEWLSKTMSSIRNSSPDGNSFLVLKTFNRDPQKAACTNTITNEIPALDLADPTQHPGFQTQLAALWEPNPITENSIGLRETCIETENAPENCAIGCGNIYIPKFGKKLTFFVQDPDPEDPDLTSIYKIRLERWSASGSFVSLLSDFSYTLEKSVMPDQLQPGDKVKVVLQQINMGLIVPSMPYLDNSGIPNDGVIEIEKTFENLDPCCNPDPIPVTVLRPATCWLELVIPDHAATGVDLFHWTTVPGASIIPLNAKASRVWVDLFNVNLTYLVFCVAGLDASGVLKVGQGTVTPLNNGGCKGLIISPIPNPVDKGETLTVLLSGDLMDEVQFNNTPLTLNFVRSIDGATVHTLVTKEEINQVLTTDFQDGLHWIITNYAGVVHSASFVVEDP
jgi:hypothetical protein